MGTAEIATLVVIVWVVPAIVAYLLGKRKHRDGLLYGVPLGWLGVLILLAQPARVPPALATRECPHCREQMRRDAGVCPHCHRESEPWQFDSGQWWVQRPDGWLVLNEKTGQWRRSERTT